MPGTGVAGMLDGSRPATGNTTLYERYGAPGPVWSVFDLGCLGSAADPGAVLSTFIGNMTYGLAVDLVSLSNAVHHLVSPPSFLSVFDGLMTSVTASLRDHVYSVFLPLSLLILGLVVMARAHRQDMHRALRLVGWAMVVVVVATLAFDYPTRATHATQVAETDAVSTIDAAVAGNAAANPSSAASLEEQAVLYPAWLEGELGRSTGPTAQAWGAKLWDSQAYTWAEAANPSAATATKQKEFTTAASAIQRSDPAAYNTLKGQGSPLDRPGAGMLALFGVLFTVPFRLIADLLVVAALVVVIVAVTMTPLLAVVGLHERFAAVIRSTFSAAAAAMVNAVIFSAAAALNILAVAALLSPAAAIPGWFGLLLCLLVQIVLWYALKPVRRLTHMIPAGYSPVSAVETGVATTARRAAQVATVAVETAGSGGWAGVARTLGRRRGEAPQVAEGTGTDVPDASEPATAPDPVRAEGQTDGQTESGANEEEERVA